MYKILKWLVRAYARPAYATPWVRGRARTPAYPRRSRSNCAASAGAVCPLATLVGLTKYGVCCAAHNKRHIYKYFVEVQRYAGYVTYEKCIYRYNYLYIRKYNRLLIYKKYILGNDQYRLCL